MPVVLNSSETSGPLSNGRILKLCSLEVYIKSFGGQIGGFARTPSSPPAYGPGTAVASLQVVNCGDVHLELCIIMIPICEVVFLQRPYMVQKMKIYIAKWTLHGQLLNMEQYNVLAYLLLIVMYRDFPQSLLCQGRRQVGAWGC